MGLFGGSKSSTTANTTENNDASVQQAGASAFRLDGERNTNNITNNVLDGGAISGSLDFAGKLTEQFSKNWTQLTGALDLNKNGVADLVRDSLNAAKKASEDSARNSEVASNSIAQAYGNATGQTGQGTLIMAVAAVMVLLIFRK